MKVGSFSCPRVLDWMKTENQLSTTFMALCFLTRDTVRHLPRASVAFTSHLDGCESLNYDRINPSSLQLLLPGVLLQQQKHHEHTLQQILPPPLFLVVYLSLIFFLNMDPISCFFCVQNFLLAIVSFYIFSTFSFSFPCEMALLGGEKELEEDPFAVPGLPIKLLL